MNNVVMGELRETLQPWFEANARRREELKKSYRIVTALLLAQIALSVIRVSFGMMGKSSLDIGNAIGICGALALTGFGFSRLRRAYRGVITERERLEALVARHESVLVQIKELP